MQSATLTASVSKKWLWAGRIITALTAMFLLFDSCLKLLRLAPAVEATTQLGYPAKLVLAIGIAELVCVVFYLIPRSSIFGAILLTGYLGGATATQVLDRRIFPIGSMSILPFPFFSVFALMNVPFNK